MRKSFLALGALALLLPWGFGTANVSANAENALPETLTYEYSGKSTLLPVWPSAGEESYSVEVKDASGNVLAANVLSYTFATGSYTLEYTVYKNGTVEAPVATHTVAVTVNDTTAPVISINGNYKRTYEVGDAIRILTAVGNDLRDGETACSVSVTKDGKLVFPQNDILELSEGTYVITYATQDVLGNAATRDCTFTVSSGEETPPTDTRSGCKSVVPESGAVLLGVVAFGSVWMRRRRKK